MHPEHPGQRAAGACLEVQQLQRAVPEHVGEQTPLPSAPPGELQGPGRAISAYSTVLMGSRAVLKPFLLYCIPDFSYSQGW